MSSKILTHFFVLPALCHLTPADLMKKASDHRIAALQELSQFTGMAQTYHVDKELHSMMKEDATKIVEGGAIFAMAASISTLDTLVLIQIRSKGGRL